MPHAEIRGRRIEKIAEEHGSGGAVGRGEEECSGLETGDGRRETGEQKAESRKLKA